MSVLKFSFVLVMLLTFVSHLYAPVTLAEVAEDEASSTLTYAEESVAAAYQSILKAEEAGANVSDLLVQLNEAGGMLAQARMAYMLVDFDEAANFAHQSQEIGEEVKNEAYALKNLAQIETLRRFWLTLVGSIVGVVFILLGSFWLWRIFERSYYRRVLKMKPEVISNES